MLTFIKRHLKIIGAIIWATAWTIIGATLIAPKQFHNPWFWIVYLLVSCANGVMLGQAMAQELSL